MSEFDPTQHRMVPAQRWFEDFVLGERFVIPSRTQTSAVFAAFQTASGDTHPIHYDVEYCRTRERRRKFTSPLGEVDLRSKSGEGFRSIERARALTRIASQSDLSPTGRGEPRPRQADSTKTHPAVKRPEN
jgi:hypothetical protein